MGNHCDTYLDLCTAYQRAERALLDLDNFGEPEREPEREAERTALAALMQAKPNSAAGAAAGLRIAMREFRLLYCAGEPKDGDSVILTMMANAAEQLDQGQAGEAAPTRKPDIAPEVFRSVGTMEDPVQTVDDLLSGILLIAEKLDGDESTVICRLGDMALRALATVEQERGKLFRLSHADRARFEREGWPGERPAAS